MKTETLLREIGLIGDQFVTEADMEIRKLKPDKNAWIKWVSFAACLAVAITAAAVFLPMQKPNEPHIAFPCPSVVPIDSSLRSDISTGPSLYKGLPMLKVSDGFFAGGEGGGVIAYDVSELMDGNPWSESDVIDTLPVYQSLAYLDHQDTIIFGLSGGTMLKRARDTAAAMGLKIDKIYTNPTEEYLNTLRNQNKIAGMTYIPDTTPTEAVAECGDVTVYVDINGDVRIVYDKGVPLPDQYHMVPYNNTAQQAQDATQYLLGQYPSEVNMRSPVVTAGGRDYTFGAQRSFAYTAYEGGDTLLDKILGYNFNTVAFSANDAGEMDCIYRFAPDLLQKMGDYPIITVQEARTMLLQGHYITDSVEAWPGDQYIADVELIYCHTIRNEVYMPYYRFYVEVPAREVYNDDPNLKTFLSYYVPAVQGQYIANMPSDGKINTTQ